MSPGGHASAFGIRETLDEAVRYLAVSPGPIQERVRASGMVILGGLSRTDFACREDRELFSQIQAALAAGRYSVDADSSSAVTDQMPDATAAGIASDILDLRDTAMGRAIKNARTTRQAEPRGRSRR
jgi:hypothetical protein